ncbi:Taste receptor type 2 member 1 [Galemys pyrenaicus]|uniref:Taste receptor type 2 member 1 n=1 Tax=Galemys pyrenaicus TaxID=202257 RepID=A0A8J6A6U7_GALPY|nr:Taste receptor type 2 member 1 [Galemys pyrenaicus]
MSMEEGVLESNSLEEVKEQTLQLGVASLGCRLICHCSLLFVNLEPEASRFIPSVSELPPVGEGHLSCCQSHLPCICHKQEGAGNTKHVRQDSEQLTRCLSFYSCMLPGLLHDVMNINEDIVLNIKSSFSSTGCSGNVGFWEDTGSVDTFTLLISQPQPAKLGPAPAKRSSLNGSQYDALLPATCLAKNKTKQKTWQVMDFTCNGEQFFEKMHLAFSCFLACPLMQQVRPDTYVSPVSGRKARMGPSHRNKALNGPLEEVIIHLLITAVQLLVGVLANGFILAKNGTNLIRQRRMDPLGLLLSGLAITRICLQLTTLLLNLALLSLIELHLFPENFATLMFVNEMGIWFATWLSVFYCTKIATIAHPLFLWLKARISRLVPWLILVTLFFVSGNAVFHSKYTWIIFQRVLRELSSNNSTTVQIREVSTVHLTFIIIGLSVPFVIFLVSILLLIFSLGRHTWQMRNTAMGTRDQSSRVHHSVLLSMLCFLVLFFSYYTVAALFSFQVFKIRTFIFHLCILVIGVYPSGHSIILIVGNPKLRQSAKAFLLHRRRCPRENPDPLQDWVAQ